MPSAPAPAHRDREPVIVRAFAIGAWTIGSAM